MTQCGPVSANIENQQVNQCGTLRWLDTGVSCSIADPVLPGSFGGGCYVDRPTSSQSYYRLAFGNNGTGTRSTIIGSGTAPFSWAPGVVDGSNYEIMVNFTFAGSMAANYTGPANGVWVSLASTVEMKWAINGPTPSGAYLSGNIYIRKVGSAVPEASAIIEETFISVGVDCP